MLNELFLGLIKSAWLWAPVFLILGAAAALEIIWGRK